MHRAFLAHARTSQALDQAARLYRIHLAHYPEDPTAEQGLSLVIRMALMPTQLPRAQPVGPRISKWISAVILVCIVLLCFLIVASAIQLQLARPEHTHRTTLPDDSAEEARFAMASR